VSTEVTVSLVPVTRQRRIRFRGFGDPRVCDPRAESTPALTRDSADSGPGPGLKLRLQRPQARAAIFWPRPPARHGVPVPQLESLMTVCR
jgi:hypothetical protein